MSVLSAEMVQESLGSLPAWKLEGKEIVRHYEFADFAAAMVFVNQVAEKAEAAGQQGAAGVGLPRQGRPYQAGYVDG
jgi:pterin-4a-carbinolamine dehydratase